MVAVRTVMQVALASLVERNFGTFFKVLKDHGRSTNCDARVSFGVCSRCSRIMVAAHTL